VNEQFSDPGPAKPTNRPRVTTEKIVSPRLNEYPRVIKYLILIILIKSISGEENGSNSEEPTTTTEAFQISRYELGRILGRNFRGLQKLAMSEFSTALNVSHTISTIFVEQIFDS